MINRKSPDTTGNPQLLTSVQALRFLAALLVLFFHLGISKSGYKGVDLFFVISGFTIYYAASKYNGDDYVSLKRHFIINRLTKIFLLYWASLVVMFIVRPFPLNSKLIGTILLIPGHNNILGVSWSLSYELYFYFLFYFFLLTPGRSGKTFFLATAIIVTSAVTILMVTPYSLRGKWVNFFAGQNLWQFLAGVLVAKVFLKSKKNNNSFVITMFVISVILFLLVSVPFKARISNLVYGSISFVVVLCSVLTEARFEQPVWFRKIINSLGNASYAIYLFSHPLIIVLIKQNMHRGLIVCTVIFVSLVINIFFENPMLRFIRRKLKSIHVPPVQLK
ncbi:MAG TPA: acyltransferase [Chitinophagaceae bacterium]|nr:acyltransferase [Chitinophagaceae bacterium]